MALSNYQRLKIENEELRTGTGIGAKPFLFTTEAKNEEIYFYLRDHPESAEFLFRKYRSNQDFIKELCDPKNPIFIEEVSEYMKDILTVETVQEDISMLQSKQSKLQHEIGLLEEELRESKIQNEKELSDLTSEIDNRKSELNTLTSKIQSLASVEGLRLLNEIIVWTDRRIHDFGEQVPIFDNSRFMPLKVNDFDRFKEIIERLKEVMDRNELVPAGLVDKLRLEYDRQKEELLILTTYALDHNVLKVHKKAISDINLIFSQINGRASIPDSSSVSSIVEYMGNAIKRLEKFDADLPNVAAMLKGD